MSLSGSSAALAVVTGERNSDRPRRPGFLAGILAALWLFSIVAASSAELHHCLHEDAPASDHQCLFTKFAEGQFVDAPSADNPIHIARLAATLEQQTPAVVLSRGDSLQPPGRGPPSL